MEARKVTGNETEKGTGKGGNRDGFLFFDERPKVEMSNGQIPRN